MVLEYSQLHKKAYTVSKPDSNRNRSRLDAGGLRCHTVNRRRVSNISRGAAYVLRQPRATYMFKWLLPCAKRQERCTPFLLSSRLSSIYVMASCNAFQLIADWMRSLVSCHFTLLYTKRFRACVCVCVCVCVLHVRCALYE